LLFPQATSFPRSKIPRSHGLPKTICPQEKAKQVPPPASLFFLCVWQPIQGNLSGVDPGLAQGTDVPVFTCQDIFNVD
jgi:hypothetical protein